MIGVYLKIISDRRYERENRYKKEKRSRIDRIEESKLDLRI